MLADTLFVAIHHDEIRLGLQRLRAAAATRHIVEHVVCLHQGRSGQCWTHDADQCAFGYRDGAYAWIRFRGYRLPRMGDPG